MPGPPRPPPGGHSTSALAAPPKSLVGSAGSTGNRTQLNTEEVYHFTSKDCNHFTSNDCNQFYGRESQMGMKAVIELVCKRSKKGWPYSFGIKTISAAQEINLFGEQIEITVGNDPFTFIRTGGNLFQEVQEDKYFVNWVAIDGQRQSIPMGELVARAGMLDGVAFAPSQYGNVKDYQPFRELYNVKDRMLLRIENKSETYQLLESAPCMQCGLVLPLRNLTVDHQAPQSGGELQAVAKVFRAFGLTKEGPQGPKGKSIQSHVGSGAPLEVVPTRPGRPALAGTSKANRYTLNQWGAVLYSFAAECGDLGSLKQLCMHSLLNLAPLCGPCNSSKGKKTQLQWIG